MAEQGNYEIELATARVEAIMAKAQAAMEILLDGPDRGNVHVAKAVKLILDDHMGPLQGRMEELEETVKRFYPNPEERDIPESQDIFGQKVEELTEQYERHMKATFPETYEQLNMTEDSVFYTLMITPVAVNRAILHLNGEIVARDPGDPVRMGYRDALLEMEMEIPEQRQVVTESQDRGAANNDRKRRFLEMAQDALTSTERTTEMYRASRDNGERN